MFFNSPVSNSLFLLINFYTTSSLQTHFFFEPFSELLESSCIFRPFFLLIIIIPFKNRVYEGYVPNSTSETFTVSGVSVTVPTASALEQTVYRISPAEPGV